MNSFPVSRAALALGLALAAASPAAGQCILSNPSFEIGGTGGSVFGGWEQFGAFGATMMASHGHQAARVSGPDTGDWAVSGYWQAQDCVPGESWVVTGNVRHPASRPLVGQNAALVNVEWRDAAGGLISYDSFSVAGAASPTDEYLDFSVTSSPAPAGTVKARLLLGVLQSPVDPSSDVIFDQVTFTSTSPPTQDDVQWTDFTGGTALDFAGRTWRVKGPGYYGPGPNVFSDSPECVWVDGAGDLHLTLSLRSGTWTSTEVVLEEALGYGDYVLTTVGRLDTLDPQAVLGLFLWEYGPCYDYAYTWWNAYNEIDIEYSRWQDPANDLAQFVAQPYDWPGNISRFDPVFAEGEIVSHAMRWLADRVEYRVWRGGPGDEGPGTMVHAWTYTGPHIPRPEQPRLHLNLWRIAGSPAADQEVVFSDFRFVPAGVVSAVEDGRPASPVSGVRLLQAAPNPFNPRTVLSFEVSSAVAVDLAIFDARGRRVRSLLEGAAVPAGTMTLTWDGRDDAGRSVPGGVYFARLEAGEAVSNAALTLLK
ncbi:hypothetical protein KJ682_07860 [bacterium]|nr:hypothetical protein [bacterium]